MMENRQHQKDHADSKPQQTHIQNNQSNNKNN